MSRCVWIAAGVGVACLAQAGFAETLNLDRGLYSLGAGTTSDGVLNFTGADTTIRGQIRLYTVTPSIATVSPATITIERHTAGYGTVDRAPFTITGVSPGSTTLYAEGFFQNGQPIGIKVNSRVSVSGCPATLILMGSVNQDAVPTLRSFRDEVLAETAAGQSLIEAYERHALEGCGLLFSHPELLDRSRELLVKLLPVVRAGLQGESLTFTPAEARELDLYFADVGELGSPSLKATIAELRGLLEDRVGPAPPG